MSYLIPSPQWAQRYPGAMAGILVLKDVENPAQNETLNQRKTALETRLREQFAGLNRAALLALPVQQAYKNYYDAFKKSYHVLFQLESVAFKGKSLPNVAALVEAMFMAELDNQLLTAGHDLDTLQGPVHLEIASGAESYTQLSGSTQTLKAEDMYMRDDAGIISSIIYGPDQRTCITPATRQALFAVYAPPGIQRALLQKHLEDIAAYAQLFSPAASIAELSIAVAES